MFMRKGSKILAWALAFVMVISLAAVPVSAETISAGTSGTYTTLQSAIDAASNGGTIQLTSDLTEDITIDYDCNVILDLAGYTLTGNVTITGGTLTVMDSSGSGNIDGNVTVDAKVVFDGGSSVIYLVYADGSYVKEDDYDGTSEVVFGGNGIAFASRGSFTLLSGTISGGVTVQNNSSFIMNGGTVSNESGTGVYLSDAGQTSQVYNVTLSENGTISSIEDAGEVGDKLANYFNMTGGTISGCNTSTYGGGVHVGSYCSMTLNGGVITNNNAAMGGGLYVSTTGATLKFDSGAIYSNTATAGNDVYLADGAVIAAFISAADMLATGVDFSGYVWLDGSGETATIAAGEISGNALSLTATQSTSVRPVASVTIEDITTEYNSFDTAVTAANAAESEATITLLDNIELNSGSSIQIPAGSDITLDLSSYTLSGCFTSNDIFEGMLVVGGKLTVMGSGTIQNTADSSFAINVNSGTLEVTENVTISGYSAIGAYGGTVNVSSGTVNGTNCGISEEISNIVITGGSVSGGYSAISGITDPSTITITGGTITSDNGYGIWETDSVVNIGSDSTDNPIITSGKSCIYAGGDNYDEGANIVTIKGGTLNITSTDENAIYLYDVTESVIEDCVVECSGGTSAVDAISRCGNDNKITISGGHFFSNVSADYIASGYSAYTEGEDTLYYQYGYPYTVIASDFTLGISSSDSTYSAEIVSGRGTGEMYVKVDSSIISSYSETAYPTTTEKFLGSYTSDGTTYTRTCSYVFAGWYSYDSDSETYTAMKTFPSGEAYAKFVDANVLTVKVQLPTDATTEDNTTSMRLLTTADALDYSSIGFKVKIGTADADLYTSTTVYTSILGSNGVSASTYPPTIFSSLSQYFATCTLTNIPQKGYDTNIVIQATWTTLDGTIVYGAERTLTVNGILNGN